MIHVFLRQLGDRIEYPDRFYFVAVEFHPVRKFVGERKNVYDSASNGKLSCFHHEIGSFEIIFSEKFNNEINRKRFADTRFNRVGFKSFACYYFFVKGFGVGDHRTWFIILSKMSEYLRAQQYIVAVKLRKAVWFFQ